jgi:hypothetical protein
MVMIVVSGRRRAWANFVKEAAVSPRPWRRRRMFGDGAVEVGEDEGCVIVTVRLGKSDVVGVFVGIFSFV